MKRGFFVFGLAVVASAANAQALFTGGLYTQNFDTLVNSGNSTTNYAFPPVGPTWAGWSSNLSTYRVSDGGTGTGFMYSMGTSGNTDRALGSIASTAQQPIFGVQLKNNTGSAVTALDISFNGEQWRSANTSGVSNQRLAFSYSTSAALITDPGFLTFSSLDVIAGLATTNASIGYLSLGTTSATLTFATPLAVDATVWLRWADADNNGSDAMFGIDDLSVRAVNAVPEPFTMGLGLAGAGLFIRRRLKR